MFSPIIRSAWLYSQYLVVFTQVVAGWCLEWVETELCSAGVSNELKLNYVQLVSRMSWDWTMFSWSLEWVETELCSAGVSNELKLNYVQLVSRMSWNWTMFSWCLEWVETEHSSFSTHSRHQPTATWVNTTGYCKYSNALLMMGENIARNM